jgi:hypothetical protein
MLINVGFNLNHCKLIWYEWICEVKWCFELCTISSQLLKIKWEKSYVKVAPHFMYMAIQPHEQLFFAFS